MKWIFRFFAFMGFIFTLIILALVYLFVFDPFGLKPLFMSGGSSISAGINTEEGGTTKPSDTTSSDSGNNNSGGLSDAQKSALDSVGIDSNSLPSSLTPAQEACFVNILGEDRVTEIKNGAVPTPVEFYKAKGCVS